MSAGPDPDMRAEIEVETLLKIILVLAVVWLALEVLEVFVETLAFILEPLPKIFGVVIIVLVVLYLLDRI